MIAKGRFDLILLDVDMPFLSGLEVLEKVHASEKLSQIPVVMMSDRTTKDLEERVLTGGAQALLAKRFDYMAFQAVLMRYLSPIAHKREPLQM